MVHSVFLYPAGDAFDLDRVRHYLESRPDVLLDPLGTPTYLVCGVPEAVALQRDERIAKPDQFPYCVLVTVASDVINVYQEFGDKADLRSARDFVRWLVEQQPCVVKDDYDVDWTERVRGEGVGVLYPPSLA